MNSSLRQLSRLIPLRTRHVAQGAERPLSDVGRFVDEVAKVLLPLGLSFVAVGVSRWLGKSSNGVLRAGAVHAGRIGQTVAPSSVSVTSELIRLLPLIPSPFLAGKLLLVQSLLRRHKVLIPLVVAGHRLVRRSRR